MSSKLTDYATAVPFNALSAHGFGPLARLDGKPALTLRTLRDSGHGRWAAIDTAGNFGRRLLVVLACLGGKASAEQLAYQSAGAPAGVLPAALRRLNDAGLIVLSPTGTAELGPGVQEYIPSNATSLADPQMMSSDTLALICRALRLLAGNRKQERIDAIAEAFKSPALAAAIRADLSPAARALLDRIVVAAGTGTTSTAEVGLNAHQLSSASPGHYSPHAMRTALPTEPLRELTSRGIVGFQQWDRTLWIWREAWPLLDRPFFPDWQVRPEPGVVPLSEQSPRLPAIVGVVDQALRAWHANPPVALKTGDPRLAKTEIRSTAKALGVPEAMVDLASRLAIGIGLLLPNEVGRSGRGRNIQVDRAWMGDPALVSAWSKLAAMHRWARLVLEWCKPRNSCGDQLLANRHLVLWQLGRLDPTVGYASAAEFVEWFGDRHGTVGDPAAALDVIRDLRCLGLIANKTVGLTTAARSLLDDPKAIAAQVDSGSRRVIVQADLTVIAPPDIDQALVVELESIAELESSAGALTFRLEPTRVTRAVQAGQQPSDIEGFLAEISSTELPDTVKRLIRDAASKAGTVRVIAAPTVVVVTDPADLTTICAIKALKLNRVTDTVAVTDEPLAKVRTALERKGLVPEAVVGGGVRSARSSSAEAAAAARSAAALRASGNAHANDYLVAHARTLEDQAARLGNLDARLAVTGPLTVTPAVLDALGTTT